MDFNKLNYLMAIPELFQGGEEMLCLSAGPDPVCEEH